MKNFLYCAVCMATLSLQGCFWHSSEVEHTVPASGSTTVVTPSNTTGSTVTTSS